MILSSCAAKQTGLIDAARAAGTAAAAKLTIDIGPLPDECYEDVPEAPKIIGANGVALLKRETAQLYRSNQSKKRCAKVHDVKRANFLRGGKD